MNDLLRERIARSLPSKPLKARLWLRSHEDSELIGANRKLNLSWREQAESRIEPWTGSHGASTTTQSVSTSYTAAISLHQ
jgi:hypothetical protein